MKFSILINTHNQNKYFLRCINSCLNQTFKGRYEIIIFDTSHNSNIGIVKQISTKNLFYFHKKKFSKYPVLDQIYKIYFAFKKSKGEIILLLDGDDFFHKDKLKYIADLNFQNDIVYHDNPVLIFEKKKIKKEKKVPFYKRIFLYKFFINSWPVVHGTSCLFFKRNIFSHFFSFRKVFKYNLIAIDIKLAIFSQRFYVYKNSNKSFTYKNINNKSLDFNYSNFFSKIFWIRRKQQLDYEKYLGNNNYTLNKFLIKIIYFVIKRFN
jgi:glycosyltransferase involved in cell wall biosynthesis